MMDSIDDKLTILKNDIRLLDKVLLNLVSNYNHHNLYRTLNEKIDAVENISEKRAGFKVIDLNSLQIFMEHYHEQQQESLSGLDTLKDQLLLHPMPERKPNQQLTYAIMLASYIAKKVTIWLQVIEIINSVHVHNHQLIDEIHNLQKVSQAKLDKYDVVMIKEDLDERQSPNTNNLEVIKRSKSPGMFVPSSSVKDEYFPKQEAILLDMVQSVKDDGFDECIDQVKQAGALISQLSDKGSVNDHVSEKQKMSKVGGVLLTKVDILLQRFQYISLIVNEGRLR